MLDISIQIQIRCLECGDGTLMKRIPGTATHARYACPKKHIRELPKTGVRIQVQPGALRPPGGDDAA